MQTRNAEIKIAAKKSLTGHWGLAILSFLAVLFLPFAVSAVCTLIFSLIGVPLIGGILGGIASFVWGILSAAGLAYIYLNLCKNKGDETKVSGIFYGFSNKPFRYIGYYFRFFLYIIVALIVYIILALIISILSNAVSILGVLFVPLVIGWIVFLFDLCLKYSQVVYLLVDHDDMTVGNAFKKSAQMMVGCKLKYLGFQLSFFLWYLLAACTFGIAMLYVCPYVACANAQFYMILKGMNETEKEVPEISVSDEEPEEEFDESDEN